MVYYHNIINIIIVITIKYYFPGPNIKILDFLFYTHQPKLWFWSLEAALTQNGLTFPICNPFVFGEKYYNFFLRYSCQHSLFSNLSNNETLLNNRFD